MGKTIRRTDASDKARRIIIRQSARRDKVSEQNAATSARAAEAARKGK